MALSDWVTEKVLFPPVFLVAIPSADETTKVSDTIREAKLDSQKANGTYQTRQGNGACIIFVDSGLVEFDGAIFIYIVIHLARKKAQHRRLYAHTHTWMMNSKIRGLL